MRKITFLITFLGLGFNLIAQETSHPLYTQDLEAQQKWVDSVYNSLDLKERIGQLFMPMVFSSQDQKTHNEIVRQVKEYKLGGIIFSKGGPIRQARLTNEYQALSKTPMLIGFDGEWGLGMRLDSTVSFPWNMTLGAINNNELIKRTGKHIGEHSKRLGIHFNFAPVVDINTNPKNPIIGNRSFGEDRDNVANKALAFMQGMQGEGVLGSAKHFPGHGDTAVDSHKTLPTINFDEKRIDSVELYPYKKLIDKELASVMVAHLHIPSLETKDGYPSSLSKNIVTNILRERLGFKGLIFTDALNMKGASNFSNSEDVDLAAFKAGNDMLLISEDIGKGINKLAEAYNSGEISEERLSHSVKKVLMAKYKVGLNNYQPIETENLLEDLNRLKDQVLYEELMEEALTVVKNEQDLLPLRNLDKRTVAYVKLGDDDGTPFLTELKKYTKVHEISANNLDELISKLNNYNTVIVGFHKSNENPWKGYKFTNKELTWLYEIARTNTTILSVFARSYALLDLKTDTNLESIVVGYQNSEIGQQKAAQLIFGAIAAKGSLPATSGENFNVGQGIHFPSLSRIGYSLPERVGMDSYRLAKIDSVAKYAVDSLMTPGIQLMVARKGKVIYNKNFGKHTYNGDQVVRWTDLYDVASLTKILATLPLVMELEEKGILSLDSKLSEILPEFKGTNKEDVTIKTMLSHYAQLTPWIPFYEKTLDSVTNKPDKKYYRTKRSKQFNIEVANNLFLRSDYQDSISEIIKESDMLERLRYKYSDLPYYILKKFIEDHYDQPLDELVQQRFYKSLGANYTTYNPRERFSNTQIVPSEIDDYWRYQEIKGHVHDMGAAMQKGVGGHAGVFSNANDVTKIMQLFLQKGYYGGQRYFNTETLDKFNECYFCESDNRRGVGFDKPQLEEEGPTCGCVSMTSFGHSGFTGTYAWADPEEELVYVFMANRTYPSSKQNRLLRENIRTEIQRLIYEAIEE